MKLQTDKQKQQHNKDTKMINDWLKKNKPTVCPDRFGLEPKPCSFHKGSHSNKD